MIDVLLDCDTGHDDAIALMILLSHPEAFNLLGITTVAGNTTVENAADNTLKVLDHLGFSVDVSLGFAAPLRYPLETQSGAHGVTGMDGPILQAPLSRPTGIHAVEYLRKRIGENKRKVTIVALGPLTNIGVLLRMYPAVTEKIESVCLMGGSLYSGNILPRAEFNIYHDPDAARIVFRSGVPITMAGLEVCQEGAILLDEYGEFQNGGKASRLVFDLMEFYSRYARDRGMDRTPIFDMTVAIELLRPELFTSERYFLDVETEGELCRGMTVADTRLPIDPARLTTRVLTGINDRKAFIGVLRSSLALLDEGTSAL